MAQILVRGLDEKLVERLKRRAQRSGRSLTAEVRMILEREAAIEPMSAKEILKRLRRIQSSQKRDPGWDSTEDIRRMREERERELDRR